MKTSLTTWIATLAVLAWSLTTTATFGYGGSQKSVGSSMSRRSLGQSSSNKSPGSMVSRTSLSSKSSYGQISRGSNLNKPGSSSGTVVFNAGSKKMSDLQSRMDRSKIVSRPFDSNGIAGALKHSTSGKGKKGFPGWGDNVHGSVSGSERMANHNNGKHWEKSKHGNIDWNHCLSNYSSKYCYPSYRSYCYWNYQPYCYPTYRSYWYPQYQSYCEPNYSYYYEPTYCEPSYCETPVFEPYCEPTFGEPTYVQSNYGGASYSQNRYGWDGNCVERF